MKIILFGDSYCAGRVPHTEKDGALKEALAARAPSLEIKDYAVSGSTAQDWCRGSQREALCRILGESGAVAIGSLGGNDVFSAVKDGRLTLAEMAAFLRDVQAALAPIAQTMPTILLIYPCPAFLASARVSQLARNALAFALKGLAVSSGCAPLDLATVLASPECWDGDDIHPSLVGYGRVAEAILAKITLMKGSKNE